MRTALIAMFVVVLTAAAIAGCGDDDAAGTTTTPPAGAGSVAPDGTASGATTPPGTVAATTTDDSTAPPPDTAPPETAAPAEPQGTDMAIFTSAFDDGGEIPAAFTCDGANDTPEVRFDRTPPGTASLALTVVDPDGSDWIHWAAWNIPPAAGGLAPGTPGGDLPDGTRQGTNDFGQYLEAGDAFPPGTGSARVEGWDGPCPPGGVHRYVFTVYALTGIIDLPTGAPGAAVLAAIEAARSEGELLATASITGLYGRG